MADDKGKDKDKDHSSKPEPSKPAHPTPAATPTPKRPSDADTVPVNRGALEDALEVGSLERQAAERKAERASQPRARVQVATVPNPPEQPVMVPAKQIWGATGDAPTRLRQPGRVGGTRVVATRLGYYADKLQRIGDVFTLERESDFSHVWMAEVDPTTPEQTTGSNAALRRNHDAIVGGSPRTDGVIVGRDDVGDVPNGVDNPLGD